ncbi:MAG: hypothetical protein J0H49_03570 [Acidobacteria bacterium]|nr:hypothetical protein [Acidobacteriota bacterium]
MSYLDNLENNLKALESREERDPEKIKRDLEAKEAERAAALKAAPHADALKTSPYTQKFLSACRTIGHGQRTFVDFRWSGTTLVLEAKGRRLELRPEAEGIQAVWVEGGAEVRTEPVDLNTDPQELARKWLVVPEPSQD